MKHLEKYDLYQHNSMRLHCVAYNYYEPETVQELISLIENLKNENQSFYILGGGSNVLMPSIINKPVIGMASLDKTIQVNGNTVTCGASCKIQSFIRELQRHNLGGIEYLYTLPCQVGGATCMNAGRGKKYNQKISDYIDYVTCLELDSLCIRTLARKDCEFSHRHSIFQGGKYIILSVTMTMESKSPEQIDSDIKYRLETSKRNLDASKPSCGSIFNKCNGHIMRILRGLRIGGGQIFQENVQLDI